MTLAAAAAVATNAISLVVPTIQAGIQIANFIKSSAELYEAGHLTEAQLRDMWKAAGVAVTSADANLQDAMANASKTKPTGS